MTVTKSKNDKFRNNYVHCTLRPTLPYFDEFVLCYQVFPLTFEPDSVVNVMTQLCVWSRRCWHWLAWAVLPVKLVLKLDVSAN